MDKFTVAHYRLNRGSFFVNGGKLLVLEDRIVLSGFFKEAASFRRSDATVTVLSPMLCYRGIRISDQQQVAELYFFPRTADKVCNCLNIT